jgi:diguanylate cyclase (GGDEF)-like protein/PAS domain S-box-containing protein
MLGYQPGEMDVSEGRFEQYVHPDDFADVMHQAEQHLIGASPQLDAEIRCLKKSGVWCWIQTRGRVVERDADGKALMMSGTHTDITERKHHQLSEREAATVFDNSYEGIMVVSPKGVITRVNQAFTRITGYAADEVIGNSPKLLSSGRQNTRFYRQLKASLLSKGFWRGEIWNRRKNGEIFAQLLSISTVYDDAGCALHHVGIFSDITQLKAHEAELDKVAHYDPLTGVPNRRLLSDRLEQSIARTNRSTKSLAVCYLDLDGFKLINDRYGHAAGDQLLIGVVENLKLVLRAEDTLARLGGDEFVLLFSDIDSPEECSLILERVLSSIKIPIEIDGEMVFASASIGVSLYPLDHVDADTLLRHADQAMYRAKETGKNRFHLFDSESDRKAQYHRQFVDRMYLALQTEEFRLYYQPKVNLLTGEIVGLEALLRWQHKEEGLLSPAQFLPHVEGSSVDHPLGIWVINTALKQVASWQAKGKTIKVSVTVRGAGTACDGAAGMSGTGGPGERGNW